MGLVHRFEICKGDYVDAESKIHFAIRAAAPPPPPVRPTTPWHLLRTAPSWRPPNCLAGKELLCMGGGGMNAHFPNPPPPWSPCRNHSYRVRGGGTFVQGYDDPRSLPAAMQRSNQALPRHHGDWRLNQKPTLMSHQNQGLSYC